MKRGRGHRPLDIPVARQLVADALHEKRMTKQLAISGLAPPEDGATEGAQLRAVHTANFPALLRQLGASLLVTTYQAGKLVIVRDEGDHLNTHYRAFPSPMGLALADGG